MTPRVSVVMAVRDGARYVAEAVSSVLGQSAEDLELIVVDDGSRDPTPQVLDGFRDRRIVRLRNERPVGAAAARNRAIGAARGAFIAIHDADDVSLRDRLERQCAFLEDHPDHGACASRFVEVDAAGTPLVGRPAVPAAEALVAWRLLLFSNPVCHSTLTIRRDVLDAAGWYDPALRASHDRDLVSRIFRMSRFHVLPSELVRYRMHAESLGAKAASLQQANSLHVRRNLLRWFLGPDAPVEAVDAWYAAPIPADRVEPLTDLLLRTYTGVVSRWAPPPDVLDELRDDLVSRLESIRRRDGRIPRDRGLRALLRSLVPAPHAARPAASSRDDGPAVPDAPDSDTATDGAEPAPHRPPSERFATRTS